MKKHIISIILMLLLPMMVVSAESVIYQQNDYSISSYSVDITIDEYNKYHIVENIKIYANNEIHGIIRSIPKVNEIARIDGSTSRTKANITNVKVSENFQKTSEGTNLDLKIGSSSKTILGEHSYQISYTYDLGKDVLDNKDEVYFNIIGTKWDTTISNVTFAIHMPKEFDQSSLGFSSGAYGGLGDNISYTIDGKTITGNYTGTLAKYNGITIRLELPEGYFLYDNTRIVMYSVVVIAMSIIFIIISFILWLKFGKDEPVIEPIEFYPPNDLNSLDIGYIYNGAVKSKDVTSLLILLANKNYLSISEKDKNDFIITKLKDYDGDNECERIFMEGLFKKSDSVSKKDLTNTFYKTTNKIISKMNTKINKIKIYEKKAESFQPICSLMIYVLFFVMTFLPLYFYDSSSSIFVLLFPLIGFTVIVTSIMSKSVSLITKIGMILWGVMFGCVPFAFLVIPALMDEPLMIYTYIIGVISCVTLIIFYYIMPKRTSYGNEIYGKVLGFKNFLKTAEKDDLEARVIEDPKYFYKILPYTYVLGVSSTWIKKFEDINIVSPEWYLTTGTFEYRTFNSTMNRTLSSASNAMTSMPVESSGSSGGGGGFSGGGSGGGGGSSW